MSDINSFEVLKVMGERNLDIRLAPLSNILRMQKTKHGTQVTIGVGGDVLQPIYAGRFVGGLILADKDQFEETKRELEKAPR
ncbi:MAG: hypothetical protein PHS14_13015 [Elusimicrobia bacterium]|nr:hypothetical protein [Elusimicrobiota bacterium]